MTPSNLTDFQQEFNRMFDDFFVPALRAQDAIVPAIDIKEDDKYLIVTAELPGVERKDVQITVQDNVLTLRGEKRSESKADKNDYHFVERSYGSFARRLLLPSEVDGDHAEATMDKGVLTMKLPKIRSTGAKTIAVK